MSEHWCGDGMDRFAGRSPHVRDVYPGQLSHQGPFVAQGAPTGADPYEVRNFASVSALHESPSATSTRPSKSREQLHRVAGLGVGLASVAAEHVLSHPCIVLRRQCQVHNESAWSHFTPFTLFQTIFNIQRHQSVTTLWKGIGSTLIVKGLGIATETALTEVTPLPKEVNRHSSVKKVAQHILLKGLAFVVVTPFYAASLVETVQSEIASERPGVLDCLRDGCYRLVSLSTPQLTRLLPVWKLFGPVVTYGVLHYIIASLAQYTVMMSVRADILDKKRHEDEDKAIEKSLYETYYPELIGTFTGNLLADTLLYPMETILHRLCLQGTRTIIDNTDTGLDVIPIITRYEGFVDCLRSVINDEGIGGLYKGFGALVLQYGLHMAILRLTHFLFRLMASEEFMNPPASPSKRMLRMDEIGMQHSPRHRVDEIGMQHSPRHRVDGLPR